MSISAFSKLTEEEIAQLTHAPAKIAVLIAGADQNIEQKEKDWAAKLVHYRSFSNDPLLHSYYELAKEDFEADIHRMAKEFEQEPAEVIREISADLARLNHVLARVDADYARALRKSWRSMARKVAEASGGLMGFASINAEEKQLIDLPMIEGD